MCGRYRLTAKERYIRDHFGLDEVPTWAPRWNIAPTQLVPIARQKSTTARRSFDLVRWGLIPSWAKDASIATKIINAMSETAAEKARIPGCASSAALSDPGQLVLWMEVERAKQKQPFSIGMADDSVFAFAGLWESWTAATGDVVESCTILTTAPNALVAGVHNRMPVILRAEDYARWLDPGIKNSSLLGLCLKGFDAALMKKYPVSTRVNRPENDDHECAEEISVPVTPTLF
jgi:putative SOS response-associated peptidase YedK